MIPARIVGILLLLLPTMATAKGEADYCNAAAITVANNSAVTRGIDHVDGQHADFVRLRRVDEPL